MDIYQILENKVLNTEIAILVIITTALRKTILWNRGVLACWKISRRFISNSILKLFFTGLMEHIGIPMPSLEAHFLTAVKWSYINFLNISSYLMTWIMCWKSGYFGRIYPWTLSVFRELQPAQRTTVSCTILKQMASLPGKLHGSRCPQAIHFFSIFSAKMNWRDN